MIYPPRVFAPVGAYVVAAGGGDSGSLDGLAGLTGAWSASRDLLTAFGGGSKYTDAGGGAISSFADQSGNGRDLTDGGSSTRRPVLTTAGPNSKACLDFDGTNHYLSSAAAFSSFVAAGAKYMIVSIVPDAIVNNSANSYSNDGVFAEQGGYCGIYLKNTAGTPETAIAFNYSGSDNAASSAVIDTGTAYVLELRHESGTLGLRVNNGTEVTTSSNNTDSLGSTLNLGWGYTSSSQKYNGKVFEAAVFSTVPSGANRSAVAANWMTWCGAV